MNKIKIGFILVIFTLFASCQSDKYQIITSPKLLGKWELKNNNANSNSAVLVFKNDNTVDLFGVHSIEIGSYDTLQINSGVFKWKISGASNVVDILCPRGSLALSYKLNKNGYIILNCVEDLSSIKEEFGTFKRVK